MTNWSNPEYGIVYLDTDNAVVEVEFTGSLDDQAACWVVGDHAARYPTAVAAKVYEISDKPWFLVGRMTAANKWQFPHLLLRVNPFEPVGGWDDEAVEVIERMRRPAGST